jgi:hypothetical protein
MVLSPKVTQIRLTLVTAYCKFILDLGNFATLLNLFTTLSNLEFKPHLAIPENQGQITSALDMIKDIISADPCLELSMQNINRLRVRTEASDFRTGTTL